MANEVGDVLRVTWKAKSTAPNTIVINQYWYRIEALIDPVSATVLTEIVT